MIGKPKPTLIYWDSCVFLAWIKKEMIWSQDVRDGIAQTVENWTSGALTIVTSSLTMLEVLSAELSIEQKDSFEKVFANPRLQMVDMDRRVSGKASAIRQFYDDRVWGPNGLESGRNMGVGDAIHLATALHFRVSEFQTLDGSGRKPKRFELLTLKDDVAGARLKIRLPHFVPPQVFSEGPIPPTNGSQQELFDASIEDDQLGSVRRSLVFALKLAVEKGSFAGDYETESQADQHPA